MTEATPAPAPGAAYSAPVVENPGKTLGIIGLVLAFVANIVGLIVSIVALKKSKNAGFKNGPALAGIIIASISVVVTVIVIIVTISLGVAAAGMITDACAGFASGEVITDGVTTITCP